MSKYYKVVFFLAWSCKDVLNILYYLLVKLFFPNLQHPVILFWNKLNYNVITLSVYFFFVGTCCAWRRLMWHESASSTVFVWTVFGYASQMPTKTLCINSSGYREKNRLQFVNSTLPYLSINTLTVDKLKYVNSTWTNRIHIGQMKLIEPTRLFKRVQSHLILNHILFLRSNSCISIVE